MDNSVYMSFQTYASVPKEKIRDVDMLGQG